MTKLYIICVDDQREVLSSIARDVSVFQEWAIVEECESAEEAQKLMDELAVEGAPVALIICDHIMPRENGVDFLARLAVDKRFPYCKKVLLTGQATQKDTVDAINKAKINNYFEKPWQPEALQNACRKLLSEYLFDAGLYDKAFQPYVDGGVLLQRLRETE
ncbi:MAG: hypothetical protein DELT_00570 [Desulfovibrio sp.]